MGEKATVEIAKQLESGKSAREIYGIRGTMVHWKGEPPENVIEIPSFKDVLDDKRKYAEAFWIQYNQQDPFRGQAMFQAHGSEGVLQYPPGLPLTQPEMDAVYALSYMGTYHPMYEAEGGVPAIREVEFSLVSTRGCFGSCSFCALTFHQGRIVQSRSEESIVHEAEGLIWHPGFKGYIHDVGGPTANFRRPACKAQLKRGACPHRQCLYPAPCSQIDVDHGEYIHLLRRLRSLPKVKKVFVRSGIRFDAVLADKNTDFLRELCEHHVSGQLKVAPEHVSDVVLKRMGKPGKKVYETFTKSFKEINDKLGKKQFLVPYLMSSHPGSSLKEAIELAEYVRDMGVNPEQVQDFIPTPGTLSTCMYYTGLDPRTLESVYVPRSMEEKAMQRALIQYRNPKNYDLVERALKKAHREDLIGYGPKCLIRPRNFRKSSRTDGEAKVDARRFSKDTGTRRINDRKGKTGKTELKSPGTRSRNSDSGKKENKNTKNKTKMKELRGVESLQAEPKRKTKQKSTNT